MFLVKLGGHFPLPSDSLSQNKNGQIYISNDGITNILDLRGLCHPLFLTMQMTSPLSLSHPLSPINCCCSVSRRRFPPIEVSISLLFRTNLMTVLNFSSLRWLFTYFLHKFVYYWNPHCLQAKQIDYVASLRSFSTIEMTNIIYSLR